MLGESGMRALRLAWDQIISVILGPRACGCEAGSYVPGPGLADAASRANRPAEFCTCETRV
jgi:hypothetical protein